MLFSNYGEIESIKLMRGREEQPLGYAFLTFVDENSCASALSLDGRIYQGRKLKYENINSHFTLNLFVKRNFFC